MIALSFTRNPDREIQYPGRVFYQASTGGFSFELHQQPDAHQSSAGSWFLKSKQTGAILATGSQHSTMTEAREAALDFIASHEVDLDLRSNAGQMTEPLSEPVIVIACTAQKLDRPAPASELYDSANFRLNLRAASKLAAEQAGRVLILSALHGLIELDRVIEPYDLNMRDPQSIKVDVIATQLARINPASITSLLPLTYARKLDAAAQTSGSPDLIDLFADAPGIGYQRGVAAAILRQS